MSIIVNLDVMMAKRKNNRRTDYFNNQWLTESRYRYLLFLRISSVY